MPSTMLPTIFSTLPTSSAVSRRLVLAGAAALLALPARAADGIGEVAFVHQWANRIDTSGNTSGLYVDDAVRFRETVATVPRGALHLNMQDGSEVRLGSDCRVVLDEFVYDPGKPEAGKMVATVGKGIARFVSGNIKQRFQVRTPTVTIGIRGTDFSVWVEDNRQGRTTIWVNEGSIVVQPNAGGAAVEVPQDSTVAVAAGSTNVDLNAPRPPSDPGLSPRLRLRPNR